MTEGNEFDQLLARVRTGDAAAAEELVRQYEGEIRRTIRVRMTDARLRQLVDSVDICQSVLANFFVRVAAGQFDVQSPAQLVGLLVTMARNRLQDLARRERAQRRDGRRTLSLDDSSGRLLAVSAGDPTASAVATGRELLARVRTQLTDDERKIFEYRLAGHGWTEIADWMETSPNTLRMRYTRAIDRVASELDLGGAADV